MITGLRFNSIVGIELDRYDRVEYNVDIEDNKSKLNEIPYVRYNMVDYLEEEMKFIEKSIAKFKHSVHIIDLIYDNDYYVLGDLPEMLRERFGRNKIAIFITVNITDEDIDDSTDLIRKLSESNKYKPDRLILKDKTTKLDTEILRRIQTDVFKEHKIRDLALCGSPFTNSENCCISAELSRHLASRYGTERTATAVATHQNKGGGCACVRSMLIDYDLKPTMQRGVKGVSGKKGRVKKKRISSVPDMWF